MRPKPPVESHVLDWFRLRPPYATSAPSTPASRNAQGRKNNGVSSGQRNGQAAARNASQVKLALPPPVSVLAAAARITDSASNARAGEPPGDSASNETVKPEPGLGAMLLSNANPPPTPYDQRSVAGSGPAGSALGSSGVASRGGWGAAALFFVGGAGNAAGSADCVGSAARAAINASAVDTSSQVGPRTSRTTSRPSGERAVRRPVAEPACSASSA